MLSGIQYIYSKIVENFSPKEPTMMEKASTIVKDFSAQVTALANTAISYLPSAEISAGVAGVAGLGTIAAGAVAYKNGQTKAGVAVMATGTIATVAAASFGGYQAYKAYIV